MESVSVRVLLIGSCCAWFVLVLGLAIGLGVPLAMHVSDDEHPVACDTPLPDCLYYWNKHPEYEWTFFEFKETEHTLKSVTFTELIGDLATSTSTQCFLMTDIDAFYTSDNVRHLLVKLDISCEDGSTADFERLAYQDVRPSDELNSDSATVDSVVYNIYGATGRFKCVKTLTNNFNNSGYHPRTLVFR